MIADIITALHGGKKVTIQLFRRIDRENPNRKLFDFKENAGKVI